MANSTPPDGGLGLEGELVAGEAGEQVGLADAGVADEDDLEEVVVVVLRPVHRRHCCRRVGDLVVGVGKEGRKGMVGEGGDGRRRGGWRSDGGRGGDGGEVGGGG